MLCLQARRRCSRLFDRQEPVCFDLFMGTRSIGGMHTRGFALCLVCCALLAPIVPIRGNPIATHIFTADPEARVFNNRLYVYTSHDLPNATYWDMVDWRLLSTTDMVHWQDDGAVFSLKGFRWATKWAWAPDCVSANGKYYLFLPVDRTKIGVAIGSSPTGPFKDAIGMPLLDNKTMPEAGKEPIDPAVLVDDDGQSYLYFGCRNAKVVKLAPSLTELAGPIETVQLLDPQGKPIPVAAPDTNPVLPEGYGEAPFIFKRAGKYYFVYSNGWAPESTQVYATGNSPMGPFTYAGKVMEHADSVTQHGSVVEFRGKWYVFYHTSELSNGNAFRRSVCFDELTFASDGTINTVTPSSPAKAPAVAAPYALAAATRVGGSGGFDYVYADVAGRRLYIPRTAPASRITVFNLDTLAPAGTIAGVNARGVAVDPLSHHGFASSKPVAMWNTDTLAMIKTIDVEGGPDGILFDPFNARVWVFSHRAPNATVIDAKSGSVVGTIDLGGAPEQAVTDGNGRIYVDIEDKDRIAVVDTTKLTVTAQFSLAGKGGGPAGLSYDARNRILFATCRDPATMVILSADDGKILTALPIGRGTDGALFNRASMEAFSSNGADGTLTVIKENSPTDFVVEQSVATMPGARTSTLDARTNRILLITAKFGPAPAPAPNEKWSRPPMLPDSFTILTVQR